MTPDQERWAEALAVQAQHGDDALTHVLQRVRELALANDAEGVGRWLEIAAKLDQLANAGAIH